MLRTLRRDSKGTFTLGNGGVTLVLQQTNTSTSIDDVTTEVASTTVEVDTRLSFFDLPAEIRNTIYEFIISESTLSLPSSILSSNRKPRLPLGKKRSKSLPTPINGVLLASKQCRREYLSLLFSCGSIAVEVKDFDFEGLIRVTCTLDEAEVQSLLLNPNLTIQLVLQNCRPKDLNALRKWLDHRAKHPVHLPWKYEFATERLLPPTTNGRIRLLRELAYYADNISLLAPELQESQKEELGLIVTALLDKVEWLEQDVGRPGVRSQNYSRNVRGLAGGGWV